jgi:hypothetical protein
MRLGCPDSHVGKDTDENNGMLSHVYSHVQREDSAADSRGWVGDL